VANALDHALNMGVTQIGAVGQRLDIAGLVALLTLIGGRVVFNFTRNWLAHRGVKRLPAKFGLIDLPPAASNHALTIGAIGTMTLALAAIAWVGAFLSFVWACAPMLLRLCVGT